MSKMSNLPEPAHWWRHDVPGRSGPLLSPLFTAEQMAAAVAAERERCARIAASTVCDTHLPTGIKIYGTHAAKLIREQNACATLEI